MDEPHEDAGAFDGPARDDEDQREYADENREAEREEEGREGQAGAAQWHQKEQEPAGRQSGNAALKKWGHAPRRLTAAPPGHGGAEPDACRRARRSGRPNPRTSCARGYVDTSTLPLLRRQPPQESQGLLTSAAKGDNRLSGVVAQVLAFFCPSIRIERQGVGLDDSPCGPVGWHLSQD